MINDKKKPSAKKVILWSLPVFIIVIIAATCSVQSDPAPMTQAQNQDFQDSVMKTFNQSLQARHRSCNVTANFKKVEPSEVDITLSYDRIQSLSKVDDDTRAMVQAVLNKRMADGHKPIADHLIVYAWGELPVKGATGSDQVVIYGESRYSYNTDQITFAPH